MFLLDELVKKEATSFIDEYQLILHIKISVLITESTTQSVGEKKLLYVYCGYPVWENDPDDDVVM